MLRLPQILLCMASLLCGGPLLADAWASSAYALGESSAVRLLQADRALSLGMAQFAREQYAGLLASSHNRQRALLGMVDSYLQQGALDSAAEILSQNPELAELPAFKLRGHMIQFLEGAGAPQSIAIDSSELSRLEAFWLELMRIRYLASQHDETAAKIALGKAQELALGPTEQSYLFLENILSGLALPLEAPDEINWLSAARMALSLFKNGDQGEAVALLENYLEEHPSDHWEQVAFVLAWMEGWETDRAHALLLRILEKGSGVDMRRQAAAILVGRLSAQRLEAVLERLAQQSTSRGVSDFLALLRIQLDIKLGNRERAQEGAEAFLKDFADSPYHSNVLEILAYLAWTQESPEFRRAANFLLQAAEKGSSEDTLFAAHAYFLNEDWEQAAKWYERSFESVEDQRLRQEGLALWVQSFIEQGALTDAFVLLERYADWGNASVLQSVWNLGLALYRSSQEQAAYDLVDRVLKQEHLQGLPIELILRFVWFEAKLSMMLENPANSLDFAERIDAILSSVDEQSQQADAFQDLASATLLMRTELLLQADQNDYAKVLIKLLREAYPQSRAAAQSFLLEADYLARRGELVGAQQRLIRLADLYPSSQYAPLALYEAAVLAGRLETESAYKDAVGILDQFLSRYAGDELEFYVRLQRAHMLKQLGDWAGAQLSYQGILKNFSQHGEIYRVQFALADTYFLRATRNPKWYAEALRIYERLLGQEDTLISIRVEAAYKLALIEFKRGNDDEAKTLLWSVVNRFVIAKTEDGSSYELGVSGRYWASRCILELARILENQGASEDALVLYKLIGQEGLPGASVSAIKVDFLSSL